ncbi:MAG: YfjI family protein [Myxococcota bacterium]
MASIRDSLEAALANGPIADAPLSAPVVKRRESVFALANGIHTRLLLDRYGIEHDEKHARCPGCGETGALICESGGLKCLHNRCACVGPPNHPGLRLNVDLVAEREGIPPLRAAELICEWFGVTKPPSSPRTPEVAEWAAPIPLGEQVALTPFPTASLPLTLQQWVEAEALATQTPPDLPAVIAIATISACLAKKFEVEIRRGWREPLNIYWLVALEPGNRKSGVFQDAVAPLYRYENTSREQQVAAAEAARTRRQIKERRLARAIEKASRSVSPIDSQAAEELAVELQSERVAVAPRLAVDDVTPERLAVMLAEQGGRLAILSAEGGLFDVAGGRYSEGLPNLDVYLKSHPGDDLRVDRVGRPPLHVRKPALTLGLAVQPDVIRDLGRKRGFRGTGLLARFFYSLPQSLVGQRDVAPPPVPNAVSAAYDALCSSLLALPEQRERDGELVPSVVPFDDDARLILEDFARHLEARLGAGGDLAALSDWANKLVGGIARIAGLLHFAEAASAQEALRDVRNSNFGDIGDIGEAPRTPTRTTSFGAAGAPTSFGAIRGATVNSAITIAHYLLDHVQAAFALMGTDPDVQHARRLLAWINRSDVVRFSKRDAWQASKGYLNKASELDAPLLLLCEHGYLREEVQDRSGPGRRPGSIFVVNPHLRATRVSPASHEQFFAMAQSAGGASANGKG